MRTLLLIAAPLLGLALPLLSAPPAAANVELQSVQRSTNHVDLAQSPELPAPAPKLTGRISKATDLIGMEVRNDKGEKLGDLKDLVLDLSSGRTGFAILSIGGFAGAGEKFIAVPTTALSRSGTHSLLLRVDKEKLLGAPSFDSAHWPDFENASWGAKIYQYHGQTPYWEQIQPGQKR